MKPIGLAPHGRDPGLQPERTALAWRRTALSLALGAFVALKIVPHWFGAWTVVPIGCGLLAAIAVTIAAHRRHRTQRHPLAGVAPARLPGAGLLAGMALLVATAGAAALTIVVALAFGLQR